MTSPVQDRDQDRLSVDREKVEMLTAELARLPEIRRERVEALSRSIREGRHQVTDQQIAQVVASELLW